MIKLAMSKFKDDVLAGKRIKSLRLERGVKQEEVATAAGITAAFLSEVENGKKGVSVEVLKSIADYFEVSTDYLLGRTEVRGELETAAFHMEGEYDELPDQARREIESFISYIKQK